MLEFAPLGAEGSDMLGRIGLEVETAGCLNKQHGEAG